MIIFIEICQNRNILSALFTVFYYLLYKLVIECWSVYENLIFYNPDSSSLALVIKYFLLIKLFSYNDLERDFTQKNSNLNFKNLEPRNIVILGFN